MNSLMHIRLRISCIIRGHIWRTSYRIVSYIPVRECLICGLIQEKTGWKNIGIRKIIMPKKFIDVLRDK